MKPVRETIPLNLYRVSAPGTARVVSNLRLTPPHADDVRHIEFDLSELDYPYLEGQSLGILTPGTDARGKANKLRLYSIASSRHGDDGSGRSASLCVKRVQYLDPETHEERRGVASNYLCDLRPGDEVAITGPVGASFLMPTDPSAHLILIATGTGIAPFRGFLRRAFREWPEFSGSITLFFGVRTAAECLYRDEIEALRSFPNFRVHYAFSREQRTPEGHRMYVQHRIAEHFDEVWADLGRDDTHVYICGLKGMEGGIEGVLRERSEGLEPAWDDLRARMLLHGRFMVETY